MKNTMIYIGILVLSILFAFYLGVAIEYYSPTFDKLVISWEAISAIATVAGAILVPLVLAVWVYIREERRNLREEEEQSRRNLREEEEQNRRKNREADEEKRRELDLLSKYIETVTPPFSPINRDKDKEERSTILDFLNKEKLFLQGLNRKMIIMKYYKRPYLVEHMLRVFDKITDYNWGFDYRNDFSFNLIKDLETHFSSYIMYIPDLLLLSEEDLKITVDEMVNHPFSIETITQLDREIEAIKSL